MLKIKDDVDLKELEKFGFKYSKGEDWHNFSLDDIDLSLGDHRELIINSVEEMLNESISEFVSYIYDLIEAGLVEKIPEQN